MYEHPAKGVKEHHQKSSEQPCSFIHLPCFKFFLLILVLVLSSAGCESKVVAVGVGEVSRVSLTAISVQCIW